MAVQTGSGGKGGIGGVAFDPAVTNVAIGGTTADTAAFAAASANGTGTGSGNASSAFVDFDFGRANGYHIEFTIQRAGTALLWCGCARVYFLFCTRFSW